MIGGDTVQGARLSLSGARVAKSFWVLYADCARGSLRGGVRRIVREWLCGCVAEFVRGCAWVRGCVRGSVRGRVTYQTVHGC